MDLMRARWSWSYPTLPVADTARTSGPAFASSICNCMFASFGSERTTVAGSCGSVAAIDGALTGTAIEADGNERPAANPATTAIPTVATLRSNRRFTVGDLPGRRDRRSSDSDQLIAKRWAGGDCD